MKRLTTLALLVFALAAVPAALADDGTPSPTQPAAAPATQASQRDAGGGSARIRAEILRLRLQIVALRFRLHCGPNGKAPADRCRAFAQKAEDRLTKLDGDVQAKLDALKACTADSTDAACRNADRKIALLTRIDGRLQKAIQKVQDWLDGKGSSTTSTDPSSDSALDQAAGQLGQLAGSNG